MKLKFVLIFGLTLSLALSCGSDDDSMEVATCTDGIQNGNETGVDCGGDCSTVCPTCTDGIQNGNETGVDCGGDCPDACATCDDGIQNGNETGVDCGGDCDAICPDTPPTEEFYVRGYINGEYVLYQETIENYQFDGDINSDGNCVVDYKGYFGQGNDINFQIASPEDLLIFEFSNYTLQNMPCDGNQELVDAIKVGNYGYLSSNDETEAEKMVVTLKENQNGSTEYGSSLDAENSTKSFNITAVEQVTVSTSSQAVKATGELECQIKFPDGTTYDLDLEFVFKFVTPF